MSKLEELLVSRGVIPEPANPANSANPQANISRNSNISRGSLPKLNFSPDLERRIRVMGQRWRYSYEELADVLIRARRNPSDWARAVALDERREREFRERGVLPRADA